MTTVLLLIQDTIEHNMAQSLQEDDHVMPSKKENQYSVAPLPRNDNEKTINNCFNKVNHGIRPQTCFHEHTK
eukprot:14662396-Ditylum_brightwellii.AAC.1